ncbi:patatin-like phospholipase family protein [Fuchsiella alkaliacetigena]|uniref:patatin-like phospholipase family protein n=1 Tax=Fuchsiella alkaliacetigena TaxID=957042 RepID=UPI002009E6B7|nr:patatin-like phospholipase family protein [Fuchsiella alkaliacetigena]
MNKQPKIGLALGAGAARGIAHIGVLQVLVDNGIKIDCIAGSSIGSLIGGFYAAGMDLNRMESFAYEMNWDLITDLTVPKRGLIAGKKVKEFIKILTKNKAFSQLDIPLAVVATDIEAGEEVVIDQGLVAEAIRASISIPGIYVPHEIGERILVDGALVNRVPVDLLSDLGADIVIGVDVGDDSSRKKINNIFDVILRSISIMENQIVKHKSVEADILIKPKVGHVSPQDLDQAEDCVAAGVEAAWKMMPAIEEAIERWKVDVKA